MSTLAELRPNSEGILTDEHVALALLNRIEPIPLLAPAREPIVITGTIGPGMQVTVTVVGDPAGAAWRLAAVLASTAVYLQVATLVDGTPVYPAGSPPPGPPASVYRLVLVLRPRSGCGRVDGATAAKVLALLRQELEQPSPAWTLG